MTVFTSAIMTLPMVPTAQAYKGGLPKENYDMFVGGDIIPILPVDVSTQGNIQFGRYDAYAPVVFIGWDLIAPWTPQQSLMGTGTYEIEYKINTNTMKGAVHLKTEISVPGGTFEGEMKWIGGLVLESDDTVDLNNVKWNTIWHGTGAYDGWTIIQNMNGIPGAVNGHDLFFIFNCHLVKPQTIS